MRTLLLTTAFLGGTACTVNVDYGGSRFRCTLESDCPAGQVCAAGFCADSDIDGGPVGFCGDGTCEETCTTCPADCGACDGAALHWKFDETGGLVNDASGNGLNGMVSGAQGTLDGVTGSACRFSAVGDEVRLAQAPAALKPPLAVAISAFVRSSTPHEGEVVSLGDSWAIRVDPGSNGDGGCRFFVYDGTDWTAAIGDAPVFDGAWHHLVGQLVGGALEIWFDGTLVATEPYAGAIDYSLGPDLVVGRHGEFIQTEFQFAGDIDEIRAFDHALTASEIAALGTP